MRLITTLLAAITLVGCGLAGESAPKDLATVRAYTDANGRDTPNDNSLGWTYYADDGDGAEYAEGGYNCLINRILSMDADADRIVRVIVHELMNAQVLRDGGEWPIGIAPGGYLWSADSLAPFAAIPSDEAAWVASRPTMTVKVAGRDTDWLYEPTGLAVERLNDAAGREVYLWR
jgi:hypothetical protein